MSGECHWDVDPGRSFDPPFKHNPITPSVGLKRDCSSFIMPSLSQVYRGTGDLLQGRQKGGAIRHIIQKDQFEEGTEPADGVGDWPLGARAGCSQECLQAYRAHPGISGLYPPAHTADVRHHSGKVHRRRQM